MSPDSLDVLKKGTPIWANSRSTARLLTKYDVEPSIVECGIEDHRVALRPVPRHRADKVAIGVFGSYERRKGQDLAVRGMLSLSRELQSRAELRFFGRILEPCRFRTDIEQIAGGNRSIVFFGAVDHDECLKQMAACDIILVPSRDDALSFVALDALSLGKALVCSRTTGVWEYLQDGRSALILHDNTPEEIGRVLGRVIVDAELRAALAKGGRAIYERTFTPQRFAENLDAALGFGRPAPATVTGDAPTQEPMQSSLERAANPERP